MADVGVVMQLPLVVSDLCLGDRTLGVVALALGGRVVGGKDCRGSADDWAHLVIHCLGLGLVDQLGRHKGAGRRIAGRAVGGNRHVRMLVEIVVVVGRRAHDGALLACAGEVDIGMGRREGRVGCADNGAVSERGGHRGFFLEMQGTTGWLVGFGVVAADGKSKSELAGMKFVVTELTAALLCWMNCRRSGSRWPPLLGPFGKRHCHCLRLKPNKELEAARNDVKGSKRGDSANQVFYISVSYRGQEG